jgi:hypothetical protein
MLQTNAHAFLLGSNMPIGFFLIGRFPAIIYISLGSASRSATAIRESLGEMKGIYRFGRQVL